MSKVLAYVVTIGLILLVGGLLIATASPSSPIGAVLVVAAALLLTAAAVAISVKARRTKGYDRVTPRD